MINAFSPRETDFSTNGLMILDPWCMKAEISEKLNKEYQLTMELAVNEYTTQLANEMVVRCPAPVRFTPALDIYTAQQTEVWRVSLTGNRLNLRTAPSLETGRVLRAYRTGTEVIVTDKSDSTWYAVVTPDGLSGYMWAGYLAYVRTDQGAPAAEGTVEEQETRDQLFRISSITSTLDCIQIEANHISYDLRRNYVKSAAIKGKSGAQALSQVLSAAVTPHDFAGHSDMTETIDEDISRTSPLAAILSDGGLIDQAGGELLRDNFDFYWTQEIGRDRGVTIAYRNNMAGMDVAIDTSDLVTRIIPIGYNKKNEPIYGEPVDSSHIGEYAQPYVVEIEYKDVKIGAEYKDEAAVRTEIERLARMEYEKGIDLPTVTASVDYVDLQKTDIGKHFAAFTGVFMGDTIRIRHEDYGLDYATRIVAYTWDCLRKQYISIELGSRQASLSDVRISPAQLGVVPGRKLAAGTVSGVELGEGSVSNEHVSAEGIAAQKIYDLDLESVRFVKAEIHRLVAGEITTDQMYADLAAIAVAQITTANIDHANIQWAQIQNLAAEIATVASAEIGTAKISFAKIYDLVSDTAIITEGVGGQLYINRLAVTDANVVSLTAGALMLKAANGNFVRLIADGQGGVTTETVTVEGDNIAAATIPGGKLIQNTITARELNVSQIFADQALVRAIKASNIDVADLFAAQATINALDSYIIQASTIQALEGQLNVWANDKISLAINNVQVGGTNLLLKTATALTKTLTGGTNQIIGSYAFSNQYLSSTKAGKQVTCSFDWSTTATSGTFLLQLNASTWNRFSDELTISASNQSGHSVITLNLNAGFDASAATGIMCRCDDITGTITIKNVKLEWGNKATSWSPAPEDTDAAIDAVNTQLSLVPGKITAAVSNVSVGGTNLIRYSKEVKIGSDLWSLSTNVSTYADADLGFNVIWINQSGATSNVWRQAWSPLINLGADWVGKQVTISGWVYSPNYTAIDGPTFVALNLSTGDRSRLNWVDTVLTYNSTNQWGPDVVSDVSAPVNGKIHRFSITFTLDASISSGTGVFADNTVMWAAFMAARNADLRFYGLKAEWGNKATAWSPAPEDPSSGVVNNSITIDTEGIKMSSSDVFQLDAVNGSKNSFINIHGLLTADNNGGLTAASGSFANTLSVGGQRVLTLADVGIPIKVSTSQPSGHGFIWLQPSSVTSVRYTGYTADSRNSTVMFSTSQRTITRSFAAEASSTLANGTFTYTLEFEVISLSDAQLTGVTFSASATKGGTVSFGASSAISLSKYQTATITLTATSTTNLASNANAISVAITATASSYGGLYLNSKQYMTLTIAKSGGSGTQGCNVYYIP